MSITVPQGDTPATGKRPQLRSLQRELVGARDQQIMRVVAMVDAMPQRSEADQLIAPLRARLSVLRPPRRMSFARLLFTPVNPLIVSGPDWRRTALAIPRTALQPLADAIRVGLGPAYTDIDAGIAALTTEDDGAIQQIGRDIWPRAAAVLRSGAVPPDWADATGLTLQDHRMIADIAAGGLADAARLNDLVGLAWSGTDPANFDLEELLTDAMRNGAGAFAAITALLAAKLPRAELMLTTAEDVAARQAEPAARVAVDRAVDAMLETIETAGPRNAALDLATGELRRIVGLLDDLDSRSAQRPNRKGRIEKLRRQIDATSRQQFDASLGTQLLQPACGLPDATDHMVEQFESTARELRKYEFVARRLGSGEHYDRMLRQAAETLKPQANETMATTVDRIRLIEILQGSEAAAAALPC